MNAPRRHSAVFSIPPLPPPPSAASSTAAALSRAGVVDGDGSTAAMKAFKRDSDATVSTESSRISSLTRICGTRRDSTRTMSVVPLEESNQVRSDTTLFCEKDMLDERGRSTHVIPSHHNRSMSLVSNGQPSNDSIALNDKKISPLIKRRLSLPLRDLTNDDGMNVDTTVEDQPMGNAGKHKRKSLSCIPPLVTSSQSKPLPKSTTGLLPPLVRSEEHQPDSNTSIGVRDKKRVRLSTLDETHAEEHADIVPSSDRSESDESHHEPQPTLLAAPPKNTSDVAESLAKFRSLIHTYTSLSKNNPNDLHKKKTIESIEHSAGYVITAPIESLRSSASRPPVSLAQKAELLMTMGPQLKHIDQSKRQKNQLVEQITACRVQKASNGQVRYRLLADDAQSHKDQQQQQQHHLKKIRPAEYEQRYMLMLEEINQIQSQQWATYFQRLKRAQAKQEKPQLIQQLQHHQPQQQRQEEDVKQQPEPQRTSTVVVDMAMDQTPHGTECDHEAAAAAPEADVVVSHSYLPEASCSESVVSLTEEEQSLSVKSCYKSLSSSSPPVTMDYATCYSSTSSSSPSHAKEEPCPEAIMSAPVDEQPLLMESSSSPEVTMEDAICCSSSAPAPGWVETDDLSTVDIHVNQPNTATPSKRVCHSPGTSMLLPLPSRDESSDDPDLARAEAKLWRAIDLALETYSEEVLAIRRQRQRQQQQQKRSAVAAARPAGESDRRVVVESTVATTQSS